MLLIFASTCVFAVPCFAQEAVFIEQPQGPSEPVPFGTKTLLETNVQLPGDIVGAPRYQWYDGYYSTDGNSSSFTDIDGATQASYTVEFTLNSINPYTTCYFVRVTYDVPDPETPGHLVECSVGSDTVYITHYGTLWQAYSDWLYTMKSLAGEGDLLLGLIALLGLWATPVIVPYMYRRTLKSVQEAYLRHPRYELNDSNSFE